MNQFLSQKLRALSIEFTRRLCSPQKQFNGGSNATATALSCRFAAITPAATDPTMLSLSHCPGILIFLAARLALLLLIHYYIGTRLGRWQ